MNVVSPFRIDRDRVADPEDALYPDSDGERMADNTLQYEWITTIKGGVDAVFADRDDVFVAGDLLWYPVQGEPKVRAAPDVLVAFDRPKGFRGSYRQWREGDLAPQVVFEVLCPGNDFPEMLKKFQFYERHGVEEYYIYDPDVVALSGYVRQGGQLVEVPTAGGWTSPRLNVLMVIENRQFTLFGPDGRPFASYLQLVAQRDEAERNVELERKACEQAQARADDNARRADDHARRAEVEHLAREQAEVRADDHARRADDHARRAEVERQAREQAEARADDHARFAEVESQARKQAEALAERLAAQLAALGVDPGV